MIMVMVIQRRGLAATTVKAGQESSGSEGELDMGTDGRSLLLLQESP